jgi:hypothetical protein
VQSLLFSFSPSFPSFYRPHLLLRWSDCLREVPHAISPRPAASPSRSSSPRFPVSLHLRFPPLLLVLLLVFLPRYSAAAVELLAGPCSFSPFPSVRFLPLFSSPYPPLTAYPHSSPTSMLVYLQEGTHKVTLEAEGAFLTFGQDRQGEVDVSFVPPGAPKPDLRRCLPPIDAVGCLGVLRWRGCELQLSRSIQFSAFGLFPLRFLSFLSHLPS